MERQTIKKHPRINEIRMISDQNSRAVNGRIGASRSRSYRPYDAEEEHGGTSFPFRLLLCVLLFFGYCFMEKEDRKIGGYDSAAILEVIESDFDFAPYIEDFSTSCDFSHFPL